MFFAGEGKGFYDLPNQSGAPAVCEETVYTQINIEVGRLVQQGPQLETGGEEGYCCLARKKGEKHISRRWVVIIGVALDAKTRC